MLSKRQYSGRTTQPIIFDTSPHISARLEGHPIATFHKIGSERGASEASHKQRLISRSAQPLPHTYHYSQSGEGIGTSVAAILRQQSYTAIFRQLGGGQAIQGGPRESRLCCISRAMHAKW